MSEIPHAFQCLLSRGGTADLLLVPQRLSQYSPTAIASLPSPSKPKTKPSSTFSSKLSFLWVPLLKHIAVKAAEDVLLRHKSQSFTALTCVILCGCRKIFEMSQEKRTGEVRQQ